MIYCLLTYFANIWLATSSAIHYYMIKKQLISLISQTSC